MALKKDFNPKIEIMKRTPSRLHKSKSISNYTLGKCKTSLIKRTLKKSTGDKRQTTYKEVADRLKTLYQHYIC